MFKVGGGILGSIVDCSLWIVVVDLDEMFSQPVTQKRADMLFTIEQQSDLFSPLVPEYKSNLD